MDTSIARFCGVVILAASCFPTTVVAQSSSTTDSSSQCTPTPISAVISNVTVANSPNDAQVRGVAISVGTPAQDFAFMPYPLLYDSTNLCDALSAESQTACISRRGGAYDPVASKTQKQGDSDATATDPSPFPSTSIFSDIWNLNEDTALSNFTFGVPLNDWQEQFYYPQAVIGLGPNSTFLNELKANDMISSRTYSFFWGEDGTTGTSNGSLVFGGYDQNKISGSATSNYTGKLNYTACLWGMSVDISELSLFFHNGTSASLFDSTSNDESATKLTGCIDLGCPGMFDMSDYDYFENFAYYTNYTSFFEYAGTGDMRSTGLNFWDSLYLEDDNPFTGDIDVTIEGGPSVTVTNDQFIVPHVYMDDDTGLFLQNNSQSDLLINSVATDGYPLRMCRHFMTFVYVMVNLDAGEFTVWAANSQSNSETLVAVDEANNVLENSAVCTSTSPSTGSGSSGSQGDSTSVTQSSSLSGGAIAGIAIGAVAGVALVGAGIWFFLRRRRAEKPLDAAGGGPPNYSDHPNEISPYDEAAAKHNNQNGVPNTAELFSGQDNERRSELLASTGAAEERRSELLASNAFRAELE
ncbi:hypothetical protein M406DRAFT_349534 [Cryphonectria parasitica EP155]|uniref:Peptidase A1 domain-containing protein n=1 Tax=Cryphonectria parasitica (strain ATCC 38755 / EP155) TaxID=660469 RepID=A0A9P4YDI6_CRYP1|nr:uncharacterized protein M406DRAFT_349534 [Cryphonectria parasitica EP155]KAF3771068.1 hypothetical protein M406DRAFT_349534 [Cryphonectria parasitica EP155]